jgi:hypothetical protein
MSRAKFFKITKNNRNIFVRSPGRLYEFGYKIVQSKNVGKIIKIVNIIRGK